MLPQNNPDRIRIVFVAEAASEGAGLGIGLHVLGYLLVSQDKLVDAPVPEDVSQVYFFPALNQLLGQIELLVEVGMPALADYLGYLVGQLFDGRGRVKQRQMVYRLFVVQGEPERNPGANVVVSQGHPLVSLRDQRASW